MRLSPLNDSGTSDCDARAGLDPDGAVVVVDVHVDAERPQDVGGDLHVADLGRLADRARAVAQDGRDHVLGDRVLGAAHRDVAAEGT